MLKSFFNKPAKVVAQPVCPTNSTGYHSQEFVVETVRIFKTGPMSQKLVINGSDRLFPVFLSLSYILSKEICLKNIQIYCHTACWY